MKKNIIDVLICCLIIVFCFSCTSLQQDVMVSSVTSENIEEFEEIESSVATLDASFCLGERISSQTKLADETEKQIDILLLESGLEKEAQSRLWALKGIIKFIEGKKIEANKCFEVSKNLYKGEVFTNVLGSRLGLINLNDDEKIKIADKKILLLEKAISNFKNKNYIESVANFDEAFISLPGYYQYAYSKVRNRAWELRKLNTETENSNTNLLQVSEITVGQMLMITQSNSNLLNNYNDGKILSENDLFKKIISEGLLNPAGEFMSWSSQNQNSKNKISKNQKLNRYMCARFLWNLYNGNKNAKKDFDNSKQIYVWSDEFQVEEVLTNYISNAINHLDNEKIIKIRVIEQGKTVRISVENTGENIPEESLSRIWEKFYKVDKARTREYGGSGIGLSIVKAIMNSLHMQCGVENTSRGVMFWFELESAHETAKDIK